MTFEEYKLDPEKPIKIGIAAQLLKVSVRTLQRWDKSGELVASRTDTDRRYYTYNQLVCYIIQKKGVAPIVLQEYGVITTDDSVIYNVK